VESGIRSLSRWLARTTTAAMPGSLMFGNPCCKQTPCMTWILCWLPFNVIMCCPLMFGTTQCTDNAFARTVGRAVLLIVLGLPFFALGLFCLAFSSAIGIILDVVITLGYYNDQCIAGSRSRID